MKVLMNADDFGFSKGVNLGILEGFQKGIITSTSLMVNMPGFEHAVELMKQYPDLLNVGIHLVTSVQYSILKGHKTITDENGKFYHDEEIIKNCDLEELTREYEAQLLKFLDTGFTPTHIDFHWCFLPVQIKAAMTLAKKYNLAIRSENKEMEELYAANGLRHNINMDPDFYCLDPKETTAQKMINFLKNNLANNVESCTYAVHPAYVDQTLLNLSSYNIHRAAELEALIQPEVMEFIKENNIELISFKNV